MTGSTSKGASQPEDARQQAADIAAGEEEGPSVSVSADYERSKEYSVSSVDTGADAANATTPAQGSTPSSEGTKSETKPTGDPNDYRQMAKEVNPEL